MNTKKKVITSVLLFLLIFSALLIIATFFDLQISRILTKGVLEPGKYDTNSTFGAVFEILGDSPVEIMLAFAIDIIFIYSLRFLSGAKKIILLIISGIFSVIPGYVFSMIVFKRLEPHILYGLSGVELTKGLYLNLTYLFFGFAFSALGLLAVNNFSDESIKKLLRFSIATIIFAAVSTIAINLGFKDIFGRMRFRSMNVLPDDKTVGFSAYSRWYEIRGNAISDETMMSVFGHTDANKSFPSGHTGAAGTSYALIMLTSALRPKKKSVRAAFWIIPIVFTWLVAVSRITVGAHFMSDVLIGGTFSFILMIIAREIIILRGASIKALTTKKNI